MRVIRKYKNRKLYDTSVNDYINLSHIKELIRNGEEFRIESKSNNLKDITKETLLRLVAEEVIIELAHKSLEDLKQEYSSRNQSNEVSLYTRATV